MSAGSIFTLSRIFPHHGLGIFWCFTLVAFLLLISPPMQAQEYFKFDKPRKKLKIKFNLHRNLIIVPV